MTLLVLKRKVSVGGNAQGILVAAQVLGLIREDIGPGRRVGPHRTHGTPTSINQAKSMELSLHLPRTLWYSLKIW